MMKVMFEDKWVVWGDDGKTGRRNVGICREPKGLGTVCIGTRLHHQ